MKQYNSQNIITTTTNNYQLIVSEDISLNGRLFVGGNVGIGKSNPSVALDVNGAINASGMSILHNTSNYVNIGRVNDVGQKGLWLNYNGTGTADDYGVIQAEHQGTAYRNLALNPNGGYLGIGKTNPTSALDVVGNVRCTCGYELNYSTLPTYTPNQFGHIMQYSTISAANVSINGAVKIAATFDSVPIGVWMCHMHILTIASSADYGGSYALSTTTTLGSTIANNIDIEYITTFKQGYTTSTYVIRLQNISTRAIYVKIIAGGATNLTNVHSAFLVRIA